MTPRRFSVSSLPLKPVVYYVLAALVDGAKHGYGIRSDMAYRSDGRVDLDPGSMYRLLSRMLDDGLLMEVFGSDRGALRDERRRYYRLAPDGWTAYVAETKRMASLVDAARASGVIETTGTG